MNRNLLRRSLLQQTGSMLIEGLVAILIFSIGLLALMGLQAQSIKNSIDAKYRADAAYLANQVLGQMALASSATVVTDFSSPNGSKYVTWKNEVNAMLPNSDVSGCTPTIQITGASQPAVTVRLYWRLAQDTQSSAECHKFEVETRLTSD